MSLARSFIVSLVATCSLPPTLRAQSTEPSPNDVIRVTVALNADGSRTTYQYDNVKHEAIATTAEPDGKARGNVVYRIDDAGRFASGMVFGPDEKFLYKSEYKYGVFGRIEQETHLTKDDSSIGSFINIARPENRSATRSSTLRANRFRALRPARAPLRGSRGTRSGGEDWIAGDGLPGP